MLKTQPVCASNLLLLLWHVCVCTRHSSPRTISIDLSEVSGLPLKHSIMCMSALKVLSGKTDSVNRRM
jgi:hypothetical protein